MGTKTIDFSLSRKTVRKSKIIGVKLERYYDFITMQELQAINEKVKELGWLDVK